MDAVGPDAANYGGQVHNGARADLGEQAVNFGPAAEVAAGPTDRFDLGADPGQLVADVLAEKAGAAGHQNRLSLEIHQRSTRTMRPANSSSRSRMSASTINRASSLKPIWGFQSISLWALLASPRSSSTSDGR